MGEKSSPPPERRRLRIALAAIRRFMLGDRPLSFLELTAPTLLALVLDLAIRGRLIVHYVWYGKLFYIGAILESLAFWWLPLFLAARLLVVARRGGRGARAAWVALAAFFALFVLPLVIFCFPGQVLYRSVVDAYMGRSTLRVGIAFRGTLRDWFASWAGPGVFAAIACAGLAITGALAFVVRRAADRQPGRVPALAVVTFLGALWCFWTDKVDSRYLQAATPDACFLHALAHATRAGVTGQGGVHQGYALRTPAPLPPLASERPRKLNVLVLLTESVRADVMCSDPPPKCTSEALDPVAGDRASLGVLTTPTPNTFTSCVVLSTGLAANMSLRAAHSAPLLWELSHALGYRTAYVTSQNGAYEDFGVFFRRAGVDDLQLAADLGGMEYDQLGAPDERATARMLRFIRATEGPWLGVLQLANTHMPYRVEPGLEPFSPHSGTPVGDIDAFHNQYRNSALLQERTIAAFLKELRATPAWDDTVVVFLSDHGEQFREHHALYHNHSLYEEELRIPGWILAGDHALSAAERAALATYAGSRTYTNDVHATLVDLLGLHGREATLPFAEEVVGRSLLRPRSSDPMMLLATSTAVWEPTDARFGVHQGERVLISTSPTSWSCFLLGKDPKQKNPLPAERCGDMAAFAQRGFGGPDIPNVPSFTAR